MRLDDFVPLKDKRILAKIDVEGYTVNTRQGMRETLENNCMILQIVIDNKSEKKIDNMLKNVGYDRFHKIEYDAYYANIANMVFKHPSGHLEEPLISD